jgi:hypothetical protein
VATEVVVSILHITVAISTAIVGSWAHVGVMPLTHAQDTVMPFGALFIGMVCPIGLTLTTVEASLALALPMVKCMLIALLLCHASNGGIVDEGGTDSMMITPCHSLSVAMAGTLVMMSLVMSPYSMINIATIVSSG